MQRIKVKNKTTLKNIRTILLGVIFSLLSFNLFGCFAPQKNNLTFSASTSTAADDLVYFADAAGTIHALQSDGSTLWQYSLVNDLTDQQKGEMRDIHIERMFARPDRKLFGLAKIVTGAKIGGTILFALDGNKLKWFKDAPLPEPNGNPVAVGDDNLYLAGDDGKLYAFAEDDGRDLWQYQVSLGIIGAPSLGPDGVVYVTGARHNLHAVGPDGKQRWTVETNPK